MKTVFRVPMEKKRKNQITIAAHSKIYGWIFILLFFPLHLNINDCRLYLSWKKCQNWDDPEVNFFFSNIFQSACLSFSDIQSLFATDLKWPIRFFFVAPHNVRIITKWVNDNFYYLSWIEGWHYNNLKINQFISHCSAIYRLNR